MLSVIMFPVSQNKKKELEFSSNSKQHTTKWLQSIKSGKQVDAFWATETVPRCLITLFITEHVISD